MATLTQQQIDDLIACRKVIVEPPRKEMTEERGSRRNDMRLTSEDRAHVFPVFMRINSTFQENFSAGLDYIVPGERDRICLLRCNGPHGEHVNEFLDEPDHHVTYHIHTAKAELLEQQKLPERYADITKEYATFEEALRYFLKRCNIAGWEEHFPAIARRSLFDGKGKP
ncbi:MAG: hypothetical protein L6Q71_01455 [Planctomycetes bacterium]|nr:hypothetical protein [Planctomycetota bacterium]NUQ35931.1 hypothetical protein [Planctomycetaceae bacterium]